MVSGHLTITNTTKLSCDLKLEQNDAFENDPTSPYGEDARQAAFHLPEHLPPAHKSLAALWVVALPLQGRVNGR